MVTHTHTHTYTHTYTHDNYYNPRCAHTHRGLLLTLGAHEHSEGYSSCRVCMCVCVCVCLGGERDQKEFGISVRKEKVKRLRGVRPYQ